MVQKSTGIDIMGCVQNAYGVSEDICGTAVRRPSYGTGSGRRASSAAKRRSSSRAEILDFRHAAGYVIPDDEVRRYREEARRRQAAANRRKVKSRRRRFRRSVTMLVIGLVIGMLMTMGIGMITRASAAELPPAFKYYDNIVVQYGDSAEEIIARYMDPDHYASEEIYIEELCRINQMETGSDGMPLIHPGTHIVVPYYSEEVLR